MARLVDKGFETGNTGEFSWADGTVTVDAASKLIGNYGASVGVTAQNDVGVELSGAKIIYKYKHYIFNEGTKAEYRAMIYEVGYKLDGRYHYNFILPDDNIVQSNSENF